MILYLSEILIQYLSSLNVLRYVSTRTMAAFFTSLAITFVFFPMFIRFMERKRVKQPERPCVSE
ncbi:MAG TPA: phospho-N-acetylmuramoyl-pentapeptide-transferase, partial [Myxococcota bacterium]|nr:phospho-N-acetylmuramoyl-pentapeptide-transferase [Myxococcota bacterium]